MPQDTWAILDRIAREEGIDPEFARRIMFYESGGNARATSPKGAMGAMQLMPGTARKMGVSNAYDAEQNIRGGIRYIKSIAPAVGWDPLLVAAAYNAGPHRVAQHGGIPPYAETQKFVANIARGIPQGKGGKSMPSEGQVQVNKKTGAERTFMGGQWVMTKPPSLQGETEAVTPAAAPAAIAAPKRLNYPVDDTLFAQRASQEPMRLPKKLERMGMEYANEMVPKWALPPGIPGMSLPADAPPTSNADIRAAFDKQLQKTREETPDATGFGLAGQVAGMLGPGNPYMHAQRLVTGAMRALPGAGGRAVEALTNAKGLRGWLPRALMGGAATPVMAAGAGAEHPTSPGVVGLGAALGAVAPGTLKPMLRTGPLMFSGTGGAIEKMGRHALGLPPRVAEGAAAAAGGTVAPISAMEGMPAGVRMAPVSADEAAQMVGQAARDMHVPLGETDAAIQQALREAEAAATSEAPQAAAAAMAAPAAAAAPAHFAPVNKMTMRQLGLNQQHAQFQMKHGVTPDMAMPRTPLETGMQEIERIKRMFGGGTP